MTLSLNTSDDPRYCTFNQAKEKGWKIKKGAKSSIVQYSATVIKEKETDPENEKKKAEKFFVKKWFHVFNFEQIEGAPALEREETFNPLPQCEEVLNNSDVELRESKLSDAAFYRLSEDCVYVPERSRFKSEIDFYKVVFHELGHATKAKNRLNRETSNGFGSESYALEELVAEIASFLVGRAVGCGSDPSSNNVSYLNGWLEALKRDYNYIFKAARLADQASRWILYTNERESLRNRAKE